MDQKTWLWRKKVSEKTIVAKEQVALALDTNMAERSESQEEELGSGRCSSNMGESLVSGCCNCSTKGELVSEYAEMTEETIAGQKQAEAEAAYLKLELDKALQQGVTAEERLAYLDAVLRECMQQIDSLREDQDERIHDAVKKATVDFEKEQKKMESKLMEANKRLTNLAAENSHVTKALLCKEKLIEDLDKCKSDVEAEFETLMARVDSVEKENTFLKYECLVLEKELEIRNEERDYSRKSADALQKQYLDTVKEITRLEAECQQLRSLVRKKLLGREKSNTKRSLNSASAGLVARSSDVKNCPETLIETIDFLAAQLSSIEEENRILKDIVADRDNELHSAAVKCAQTVSRLTQVEAQLKELSEGEKSRQLVGYPPSNGETKGSGAYITSSSTHRSCTTALLTEMQHSGRTTDQDEVECKAIEVSEISHLMDDFVEMEKLALITTDALGGASWDDGYWLQDILKIMLQEHYISKRSFSELLDVIKLALAAINNFGTYTTPTVDISNHREQSCEEISGYLTWTSSNLHPINDIQEKIAKDATCVGENIKKHFGLELNGESELDDTSADGQNVLAQMIRTQSDLREENKGLKCEIRTLESVIQDSQIKLQSATKENEVLTMQLLESRKRVGNLEVEVETLKESTVMIEDQIENQKSINDDLDTELTVAKAKVNEILQKLSSLEIELEDRNICCEDLEVTCLELQLQLETLSSRRSEADQAEKELKAGWDIISASEELVDSQDTISLGKQLKGLVSSETGLSDTAFSSSTTTTSSTTMSVKRSPVRRCSLRDRMLAENDSQAVLNSSSTQEIINIGDTQKQAAHEESDVLAGPLVEVHSPKTDHHIKQRVENTSGSALAIVPTKKLGGRLGFFRKLFLRKKVSSKKNCNQLPRNTSKPIHMSRSSSKPIQLPRSSSKLINLPQNTSKRIHLPQTTSKLMH